MGRPCKASPLLTITITKPGDNMRTQHTERYFNFINNNKLVQIARVDVNDRVGLAFELAIQKLNNLTRR